MTLKNKSHLCINKPWAKKIKIISYSPNSKSNLIHLEIISRARISTSIKMKTKEIQYKILTYLNLEILKAIVTKWISIEIKVISKINQEILKILMMLRMKILSFRKKCFPWMQQFKHLESIHLNKTNKSLMFKDKIRMTMFLNHHHYWSHKCMIKKKIQETFPIFKKSKYCLRIKTGMYFLMCTNKLVGARIF